ncbi:MAG: adenylosuccinate synthase [Buchnera aphidicola (Meitanaphis microgallis)]
MTKDSIVILGTQWGDEGKGKIVDFLTETADYVVRYQGGHNAGHTLVVDEKKIVLHILPSGILHNSTVAIIANGMVLSPVHFLNEINMLKQHNYNVQDRIIISESCHLIFNYHIAMDIAREKKRGKYSIGTTQCGIGPAYEDKVARRGLRVGDLQDWSFFSRQLRDNVDYYNHQLVSFYHADGVVYQDIVNDIFEIKNFLIKMTDDVSRVLESARRNNKLVVFEGAQGTLLDIDHGMYPYVTSSNSISGGVCIGSGIGPSNIRNVLGVVKSYSTRVGNGPFPTEVYGDLDTHFCINGNEFGSTTGRRRRTGWLDIVLLQRSISINSISKLCLTKLDVLDNLKKIKICVGYEDKESGFKYGKIPCCYKDWKMVNPIYEVMEGWDNKTLGITNFYDLPILAKQFIFRIEEILGISIDIISTGPNRRDTIVRNI